MPARNSSRPATLTRTYWTASYRSATCLVACPVLPEGPAVPGSGTHHQEGDQDPGSRHRWVAARGDLAIPPEVQAARAVLGKRAGSQQVGVPRRLRRHSWAHHAEAAVASAGSSSGTVWAHSV